MAVQGCRRIRQWLMCEIYGSKGSIFWHQEEAEKLIVVDSEGKIQEVHRGHHIIEKNSSGYDRMSAGHAEGLYGAMGNLYQSFLECEVPQNTGRRER